jgi:hypothetical protein
VAFNILRFRRTQMLIELLKSFVQRIKMSAASFLTSGTVGREAFGWILWSSSRK